MPVDSRLKQRLTATTLFPSFTSKCRIQSDNALTYLVRNDNSDRKSACNAAHPCIMHRANNGARRINLRHVRRR